MKDFTGDALIVESEHDGIVPRAVLSSYKAAFDKAHSLTCRIIKGADHSLSDRRHREACGSLLVHWLREMMLVARGQLRGFTADVRGSSNQVRGVARPER